MSTHGLFGSAASRVVSVGSWSRRHKVSTVVILALLGWGAYVAHGALFPTVTPTKYAVEAASKGTITTSVSGTGQVSASSEIAVTPQTTSGAVTAILVKAGDLVHKGDPVAKLDDTDAAKALRNAELSYQSAQLSYAKLMEPSSTSTLLQSQNSVSSAEESIASKERAIDTAYVNTFHDIADGHTSLGATIDNLTTLLEGNNAYANSIQILIYNKTAQAERKQADAALTAAKQTRAVFEDLYDGMSASSPHADIDQLLASAQDLARDTAEAVKLTASMLNAIQQDANAPASAASDYNTWSSTLTTTNNTVASFRSDQENITNARTALADAQRSLASSRQSLADTVAPPDALSIKSAEISLEQSRNSLHDAQQTLADTVVRSPIDGIVAEVDATVGVQAGSNTTIATVISPQEVADLTLNEVDVTNVKAGQHAILTFDALPNYSLVGTVSSVNLVASVSQGVVTYPVEIAFSDPEGKVLSGMTVTASIVTASKSDVIIVPASAVKGSGSSSYVEVIPGTSASALPATAGTQGIEYAAGPRRVSVTTGLENDTEIEITSGLSVGDLIVTRTIAGTGAQTPANTPSGGTTRTPSLFPGGGGGARVFRGG